MKVNKENTKKAILSIFIIIILSCVVPIQSHAAAFTGVLTKPICWAVIKIVDGVNIIGAFFCAPAATVEGASNKMDDAVKELSDALEQDADSNMIEKTGLVLKGGTKTIYDIYYNSLMSPDKIFSGDVKLLDANIFSAKNINGKFQELIPTGQSLASGLKNTVSNIYILLRNICAVILLCLLIYTGIRILLMSASPYDQAKWKQALIDWVKALCLLMFMHIIMIGIFYISDGLVEALKQSYGDQSIVAAIRWSFHSTSFLDGTACIINMIMYIYVTYLTIVFFVAYFKRLVWIVILILFAPVVATTYAIGQKAKVAGKWMKEFIFAVLMQPFHMLIFYVLVALPVGLLAGGEGITNLVGTNYSNLMIQFYVILSISMIRPAEKFLMGLFGFSESQVSKQGSSESGVKTIKATEKVVKEVVKTGAQVAAVAATAGASAPAMAAGVGTGAATTGGGIGATTEGIGAAESATNIPRIASEGAQIASERNALDEMYNEGMSPESNWDTDDYKSYMKLEKEQSARESAFAERNNAEGLSSSAEALKEAAEVLKEAAENFDISDAEFDETMGDKKPKNKFIERLESNPLYNYAKSADGKERFNELRAGANELRDSMYLSDAPQEWKKGESGYDRTKGRIDESKKAGLNAFVNNKNNVNYMMREHNLSQDDAKKRLQEAEPYINRGITDIGAIDKMISAQREGRDPNQAIRTVASEAKIQATTNRTVNDQSKISAVAQIIAKSTGDRADSPRVQQQAKQTMEAARPYIAKGEKDPEVLHRLVQLENNLKNAKAGANVRTPDKVIRMDKKIDKAMKDGLNKVEMKTNQSTSQGMKQIESVMNKELRNRKALESNN